MALIIFVAYGSINASQLQSAIIHNAFNNIYKKYTIIWLYVDAPEHEKASKNLDLEKSVYKTNIQPYSVLLKNGKVIDKYDGFSILDLNKYRKFLKI